MKDMLDQMLDWDGSRPRDNLEDYCRLSNSLGLALVQRLPRNRKRRAKRAPKCVLLQPIWFLRNRGTFFEMNAEGRQNNDWLMTYTVDAGGL
jgi:hypothetical protein